jgi:hypothetical protein
MIWAVQDREIRDRKPVVSETGGREVGVWNIEREPDGAVEVFYTDKTMARTSCGLCSPSTPTTMVVEWVMENGDAFDIVIEKDGRQYVKLPQHRHRRQ